MYTEDQWTTLQRLPTAAAVADGRVAARQLADQLPQMAERYFDAWDRLREKLEEAETGAGTTRRAAGFRFDEGSLGRSQRAVWSRPPGSAAADAITNRG